MTENDCQEPVIGVSFDGTGYGTDGTIWGGEILLADYQDFTRFGSITPFFTDWWRRFCKRGMRIAVSMIYGYTKDRAKAWEIIEKLGLCSEQESKVQFTMAERKINAVMSTSAGRVFDAVSAILGIRRSRVLRARHLRHCSLRQRHLSRKTDWQKTQNRAVDRM